MTVRRAMAWFRRAAGAAALAALVVGCCGGSATWVGGPPTGDVNEVTVHFLLQNATDSCLSVQFKIDDNTVIDGTADGKGSSHCVWASQIDGTVIRGTHDMVLSGERNARARFELRQGLTVQIRLESSGASITSPAVPSGC